MKTFDPLYLLPTTNLHTIYQVTMVPITTNTYTTDRGKGHRLPHPQKVWPHVWLEIHMHTQHYF